MTSSDLQYPQHLPALSRRREPRIEVGGAVRVRPAAPGTLDVLELHDLSFRGFSVDTPRPVAPRTRVLFQFEAADDPPVIAVAAAVHCHRLDGAADRWRSGWEFPEQPGLELAIERLLDRAVGILIVE